MTVSYTTGTVSVVAGNAVVTGVGTGWLTSGLVAGQFGLDSANGNPVPVKSIDSDTQITLVKPWRGADAAGQAYWITYDTQPGQQTVTLVQRLAEYFARLDKPTLAALAGLAPAADKLAYFTGPNGAALTDFSAAARALLAGGIIPEGQLPNRLKADLVSISDWNLARDTGFYYGQGSALNSPAPGITTLGYSIAINDSFVIQRVFAFGLALGATNVEYVREISGGTPGAWFRTRSTEAELDARYNRLSQQISTAQLPSQLTDVQITNANTFLGFGRARGNNVPGAPSNTGDGDWYTYQTSTGSGWGYQTAVQFFSGRTYIRYYRDSAWQPWRSDVAERGANGNGEYTRFNDGTQICFASLETPYFSAFDLSRSWNFPVNFVSGVSVVLAPTDNWYGNPPRNYNLQTRVQGVSNGSCQVVAANSLGNNSPGDRVTIFAQAMGRWF